MSFNYATPDGEKFHRKLPARQQIVDEENVNHKEAKKLIEPLEHGKEGEETLEVFSFRVVEHYSAERTVKIKATDKERAEERAEGVLVGAEPELTHKMHTEIDKLSKVDEVPRSKILSGEYYDEEGGRE